MFIIVGNDIHYKQVLVRDTRDNSIEMVSHDYLQRAVNRGLEVKGLDSGGNILCQSLKVEDEILPQMQQIYAKALVLNASDDLFAKMILNLVKPYGFASAEQDIYASVIEKRVILKVIGSVIFLKDPCKTVNYFSIKLVDDFKQLDDHARYMLNELVKVPFLLKGSGYIDYIIEERPSVYYLKVGETICQVSIAPFNRLGNIVISNHIAGSSPYLYKYYLEKLQREMPAIPYFIDEFVRSSLSAKDRRRTEEVLGKVSIVGRLIYQRRT